MDVWNAFVSKPQSCRFGSSVISYLKSGSRVGLPPPLYIYTLGGGGWRESAGVSPPSRGFSVWKANHGEPRLCERCAFQWEQESGPQRSGEVLGKKLLLSLPWSWPCAGSLEEAQSRPCEREWKQSHLLLARFCLETENHFSSMSDKPVCPVPHSGQVLPFHLIMASNCSKEVLELVATLKLAVVTPAPRFYPLMS